jgi:WD40 repeat protein
MLVASGGEDELVLVWRVEDGHLLRRFEQAGAVGALCWSANGEQLLIGGTDGTVRWWNPKLGVLLATVQAHDGWVRAVRISPDGKILASCGEDGTIRLWNMHSHQHLATLRAERPYERLDISETRGLTNAQQAALQALGAVGAENATSLSF